MPGVCGTYTRWVNYSWREGDEDEDGGLRTEDAEDEGALCGRLDFGGEYRDKSTRNDLGGTQCAFVCWCALRVCAYGRSAALRGVADVEKKNKEVC